jgi:hypothetical protein
MSEEFLSFPRSAWERRLRRSASVFRPRRSEAAERPGRYSHAERGNERKPFHPPGTPPAVPGRIIKGVHTLALVPSEGRSTQEFPARDRRAARRRLGPGCFLTVPQPSIGLATAAPHAGGSGVAVSWLFLSRGSGRRPPRREPATRAERIFHLPRKRVGIHRARRAIIRDGPCSCRSCRSCSHPHASRGKTPHAEPAPGPRPTRAAPGR